MNFKKICKFFTLAFVMLSSIFVTTKVNAAATRGDIVSGNYLSGPYYVMHEKPNGSHMWLQAQFIIRTSDDQFVYCVQPYFTIKEDNTYNVTTEDIASVANITPENWEKIAKIAYYGYGYTDATHNHSEDKWYIASQMLIWNLADPSIDSYFTNTLKGTRNDNILKAEQNEIMDLVNNHSTKPSLNNLPSSMTIGQTITVNDSNNVLNYFNLYDIKNGTVTKNGNSLSITATNVGTLSFSLNKLSNRYGNKIQLYYAVDSQNVIRRGDIDPIGISKNITVYGGDITVHKTDSETIENKPQGEATLNGAVYGIYQENGTKVATITTGNDGKVKSDYLPNLGRFYVQEEKPSVGYELDYNKYYFDVTVENLHPEIQVYEQVIKREFEFTKVYADSKTGIMTPEVGVQFGIYNNKKELVTLTTTDNQGNFKVKLPYGTYTVKQLTSTKGYEKAKDFTIEVKTTGEVVKKVIANAEITAKLRVIKIDKDTGAVIKRSNIKFKIVNAKTGEYVKQQLTYPTVKTLDVFETDSNGIMVTPYPLGTGTYYLEEVDQVIDGYLWNDKSVEFTIDDNTKFINDETIGVLYEVKFDNKEVKGEVTIHKNGEKYQVINNKYEYSKVDLSGVQFGLYAKEDIISQNGVFKYKKGTLIGTYTTDEKGNITIKNLYLGKYYLQELETDKDHVLDTKKYEFELKYENQYTEVVKYNLTMNNYLKKGDLEFSKLDLTTGKEIANTKVQIFNEKDGLVFEGITDSKGKIKIEKLVAGKYYIVETEASTGYVLSDEKVYFEIKENGEVIKASMTNKKITGSLEFTKKDFSTDETLPNTKIEIYNEKDELIFEGVTDENGEIVIPEIEYGKYYILEKEAPEGYVINEEKMYFEILEDGVIIKSEMKDKKIVSTIKIHKVDENNNPLEGVTIGIYDLEDNLIYSGITDSNGDIEYELEYGKYYFQEIETIEGYNLNDEKVYFDITEDGEYIQHTLVNESIIVEVPNTNKDEFPIVPIAIGFSALGLGLIIYGKKKN